jgi:DNA-nicking Smr family endonuclease
MSSDKKKPFNEGLAGLQKVKAKLQEDSAQKEREKKAAEEAQQQRTREQRGTENEADAFMRAMSGVRRLESDGKGEVVRQPSVQSASRVAEDEVDALVDLASAIDPEAALEQGAEVCAARGLDLRIVKRLAKGGFPLDAQLDLHGLRKQEAEKKVEQLIKQSRAQKLRALLVITGKGAHSDPGGPVLRDAIFAQLTRGALVKHVLAVAPATKEHGGDGAFYVLLRRR